eukprot:TRINITY_DN40897_c0_g1_i1.p1 TRINITY_DN40897_c0_g1~~TRINITY_DN40897_c0_g1_i1.p1  ORF type:complete len:281 (-),score=82.75 TRINITY_DN40897_c0_g1_i1:208-1050(-)
MSKLLCVAFLGFLSLANAAIVSPVANNRAALKQGVVAKGSPKQKLVVCNAYPYTSALDILLNKIKMTKDLPVAYKTCRPFMIELKEGDKIKFDVGDTNAGSFSVSGLPDAGSTMLLVIYRHDAHSTTVAFESHVFSPKKDASQVAIINTFKGKGSSVPRIRDASGEEDTRRNEPLKYGSVITVSPGKYEFTLDADGDKRSKKKTKEVSEELNVEKGKAYVMIRAGIEAEQGPSFPEELIVYPQGEEQITEVEAEVEKSAAASTSACVFLTFLASVVSFLF